jgi:hypothetical protein
MHLEGAFGRGSEGAYGGVGRVAPTGLLQGCKNKNVRPYNHYRALHRHYTVYVISKMSKNVQAKNLLAFMLSLFLQQRQKLSKNYTVTQLANFLQKFCYDKW